MESVSSLIVVPVRAESADELEPILQTLVSLRSTAPEAMVLIVDDRSPAAQAALIEAAADELECAYVLQQDGEGLLAALNVGLSAAHQHGMDAVLVASGVIMDQPGWLDRLLARTGPEGAPAAIAGGAVLESGMIRHAGYFFTPFRRGWLARFALVPEILLDKEPALLCPVSLELTLVRHEWIDKVGLLDELLDGPHGALDYCLRVTEAGGECVFEPTVRGRAVTVEEGNPDERAPSSKRLRLKHAGMNFQRWAPEVI